MDRYEGFLGTYFETGCEGTFWVLDQNGKTGYDQHAFLENGDEITIYDECGETVYTSIIKEDRTTNLRQRPFNSIVQPVCKGRWVHWLQSGVDPELWGSWFFSGRYRGLLIKRSENE